MNSTISFFSLIQSRHSTRHFQSKSVSRRHLLTCVNAARFAPSAQNTQPWRFILVDDPALKQQLGNEAFSGVFRATRWAMAAPVLVALCARRDIVTHRLGKGLTGTPYFYIDCGIAGEHFCLQAQELGLGTCWIGWFNRKKVTRILNAGRDIPIVLFAVGYPATDRRHPHKRKALPEICRFNLDEKTTDSLRD